MRNTFEEFLQYNCIRLIYRIYEFRKINCNRIIYTLTSVEYCIAVVPCSRTYVFIDPLSNRNNKADNVASHRVAINAILVTGHLTLTKAPNIFLHLLKM